MMLTSPLTSPLMLSPVISLLDASPRVAEKAAHMSEIDPHGSTLTLVSVSVVFGALIILFIAYTISGKLFTRKKKAADASSRAAGFSTNTATAEEEIAAAIAIALYEEEMAAAASREIANGSGQIHDYESGIITIKR